MSAQVKELQHVECVSEYLHRVQTGLWVGTGGAMSGHLSQDWQALDEEVIIKLYPSRVTKQLIFQW